MSIPGDYMKTETDVAKDVGVLWITTTTKRTLRMTNEYHYSNTSETQLTPTGKGILVLLAFLLICSVLHHLIRG